jgi:hypothetical protein
VADGAWKFGTVRVTAFVGHCVAVRVGSGGCGIGSGQTAAVGATPVAWQALSSNCAHKTATSARGRRTVRAAGEEAGAGAWVIDDSVVMDAG